MTFSTAMHMMLAAAATAGAVPGRLAARRHPRSGAGASFPTLYCGANASAGQQFLFVNLTAADCTSETLPLLATYAGEGITANDLTCGNNGNPWIYSNSDSDCRTVVAALNAQLGGAAFSCFDGQGIQVITAECAAKVAALNEVITTGCRISDGSFDYLTGSCNRLTNCTSGSTFQTVAPTATTDRVCSNCSACPVGQQTTHACNLTHPTACGIATNARGSGTGAGASFSPLYCGVGDGDGQQYLAINVSEAECTDQTLPLLATYAGEGIKAADLDCTPGLNDRAIAWIASDSECTTVVAALNTRLERPFYWDNGPAAFSCNDEFIQVNATECADKVAAINDGITTGCRNFDGSFNYLTGSCPLLTNCNMSTTFQTVAPTVTTDRVCGGSCGGCPAGQQTVYACNLTHNTGCGNTTIARGSGTGSEKLSAAADAGITILVLLVLLGVGVGFMYHSKSRSQAITFQQKDALHERLLEETRGDLEEATASNTRMRAAWQIKKDDVKVEQLMAEGAAGKVHAGWYAGHKVAVKVLKQALDPELSPEVAEDFARECETLMSIRHASLLIFYGAGTMADNRPFMVTEFMALGSLKRVLADQNRTLAWGVRIQIAAQVADGVAYLHELQIVHRDLKSDNVLLNGQLDAKVADFGTSKLVTASRAKLQAAAVGETSFGAEGGQEQSVAFQATMTKGVGTPLWMAPELFVGGTKYGAEVDMYSFGVIMWELVTRKTPWEEKIPATQYIMFFAALCEALENGDRPAVPVEAVEAAPEFVALMIKCWAGDPTARPEAAAVAQLLEGLLAEA